MMEAAHYAHYYIFVQNLLRTTVAKMESKYTLVIMATILFIT